MFNKANVNLEFEIHAKVKRASDGKVFDLGRIDGSFPWRAWLYKVRFHFHRIVNKLFRIKQKGN